MRSHTFDCRSLHSLRKSQSISYTKSHRLDIANDSRSCRALFRNSCADRRLAASALGRKSKVIYCTFARNVPPNFNIISRDGRWKVRLINKDNLEEIRAVVKLQTDAFHQPHPFPLLDTQLKRFFGAEVLAEMNKKLKYNPEDRFVCLVAEDVDGNIVGIVEVSYIDEKEVLSSLEPGTLGVTYIQSMAVDVKRRRQGTATALLTAAEQVAKEWAETLAVLHVYQDNASAVKLYEKQGFRVIFQDSSWWSNLGVRPRFLMRKNL